ncbi:MAG: rhodanese-like domain-containing protein [SAR324 cluster bacterium]|nr:rhodanese-like domain-containing protein [SAR324 cluster bacterium]
MKKMILLVSLISGLFFLTGCEGHVTEDTPATPSGDPRVINVTKKEASQVLRDNKDNPNFVVLDLRTPEEFVQGHVVGAQLINFNSPNFALEVQKLDPAKTYLIYCASGFRSSKALHTLRRLSLSRIYHLQRGLRDGYPARPIVPEKGENPYKIKIGI